MSATFVETGALQSGIYLSPATPPPNAFLFLTLDINADVDSASARVAVRRVLGVLTDLRAGLVRDLLATREEEADQPIDAGTFDFLLGYGASFFDSTRGFTRAKRPARLTGLTRHREPFANLPWSPEASRGGEGDLCLQLTGRDAHAVSRAAVEVWKAIGEDRLPLAISGSFDGFARDDG
ncbi:MAG: hypothetical protein M3355_07525, partial [Actinomycetota bacterium]|nr:hypothetical protein [Actinomycetota bacterium]